MNIDFISDNCVFYNYDNNNLNIEKKSLTKKDQYISQIVSYNLFLNDEINIVNIIKNKIPEYNDYYYLFVDYYKMLLEDTNTKIQNDMFIIIKNINLTKNRDLTEEYLFQYKKRQFIYFKEYLKALNSSRKYIFQLINFYKYLLDGIQKLVNINIVHCNIKLDKLFVDTNKEHSVLLTDFRYSIKIENNSIDFINKFRFEESESEIKNNMELPIEFYILFYMTSNKITSLSQYNIHNIIDNIYKPQYIFLQQSFGDNLYNQYINDAKDYYSKYVNKSMNYILSDMSNWFYTWDNYSISIVYLKILIGLHTYLKNKIIDNNDKSELENSIIKNKFLISFMKLLVMNIHPNPTKRKNISETLELFDKIIYSCESKVYVELINNI
jgi:hypothetical protein